MAGVVIACLFTLALLGLVIIGFTFTRKKYNAQQIEKQKLTELMQRNFRRESEEVSKIRSFQEEVSMGR